MNKKLLVIGHGRHGKDTVCEILRDKYNYTFESSSKFCSTRFIYNQLKDKYGYVNEEQCYADRHNHRAESKDSMSLEQWMANFTIDNNGSLEELQFNVDQLMSYIRT